LKRRELSRGRRYASVLPLPVGADTQTSCAVLRPPANSLHTAAWTGKSSVNSKSAVKEECFVAADVALQGSHSTIRAPPPGLKKAAIRYRRQDRLQVGSGRVGGWVLTGANSQPKSNMQAVNILKDDLCAWFNRRGHT
jgi:hypothetical protein